MTNHKGHKGSGFRGWYITLPIAVMASVFFIDFLVENWAMMTSEDNPIDALAGLMIYSTFLGTSLIIAIVAWILTVIFIVRGVRSA